ncbi:protein of unknown function [Parapedobacter luteus]|uniref:DUF4859 domain-containing protein n=1 Tax=Parapedobacter luteus TaxID=623280 RepID=A0A1T4ZVX2_9SPHI|nr:DUF4859 domain-containing protein [Parapedobacter luteus]SKB26858.1 protein of unknown function [Parapedobacter luteus]
MKVIYFRIKSAIVGAAVLLGFLACEKDAYLTDEGLHQADVSLNTYDYLAAHPHHMFDSLLMVIDHFGLKDEINNARTFWAPSDYSVSRYYQVKRDSVLNENENASYSFEEFLQELHVDSVRAYINSDGSHWLGTAETSYTYVANPAGSTGFAYHKILQPKGQWTYQDIYLLYFVRVRGEADQVGPDGNVRVDRNDVPDLHILCQTSGIKTASGTTLNVLANTHTFLLDFASLTDTGPFIEDLPDGIRFTYDVSFRPASGYVGTSVVAPATYIAEVFRLQTEDLSTLLGNSIVFYAIEPDGSLNSNSTANAPGHWFNRDGKVVAWGDEARIFSEYNGDTFTFSIGQYPDRLASGDTYTVKQAMVYTNRNNQQIRAEFVFNITIN